MSGPQRRFLALWLAGALLLGAIAAATLSFAPVWPVAAVFFVSQDAPVLVGAIIVLALVLLLPWPASAAADPSRFDRLAALANRRPWAVTLLLALAVFVVGAVGAWLSPLAYPLSMDEYLAGFDAAIFRHLQPMAPVAPAWRPFAAALAPMFVLPFDHGHWWVSAYLPVNAAFRALASGVGAAKLVNPLWSALAIVAVYAVARRLWPQAPRAAPLAALLLATSSQLLLTAMTSYAMPAHLALNLVWLWCFLRGDRLGHVAAALVSLLACGLHQLFFHPLFAAPFVLQLWLDRRWRSGLWYTLVFAGIGLFWLSWWPFASALVGAGPAPGGFGAPAGLGQRLLGLMAQMRPADAGLMAINLVRFATWQNPLVVPLLLAGAAAGWRAGGAERAILAGFVLTLAGAMLLMPYQGYGWGYRYFHGLLGSAALIAARRWTCLRPPRPRTGLALATAAAMALVPVRLLQAQAWIAPYAAASVAIGRAPAPIVLLEESGIWFGRHLARNDPYLSRRPLVLDTALLGKGQIAALCARRDVVVFDRVSAARFGIRTLAAAPADPALAACAGRPRL